MGEGQMLLATFSGGIMGQKLYRANALLPFSALELPWSNVNEQGQRVPLRLEDPPADSDQIIGFLPIFGNKEAADAWSKGRFTVEEITLNHPTTTQRRPAYATVSPPQAPDNPVRVNTDDKRNRRRGRK